MTHWPQQVVSVGGYFYSLPCNDLQSVNGCCVGWTLRMMPDISTHMAQGGIMKFTRLPTTHNAGREALSYNELQVAVMHTGKKSVHTNALCNVVFCKWLGKGVLRRVKNLLFLECDARQWWKPLITVTSWISWAFWSMSAWFLPKCLVIRNDFDDSKYK